MNKFFTILLLAMATLVLSGCATSGSQRWNTPAQQDLGPGKFVQVVSANPADDIFGIMTEKAVRVPQQSGFSIRWVTLIESGRTGRAIQRALCEVTIRQGGSFTAGTYPCQEVRAFGGSRFGDRRFTFVDPRLGEQTLNLSTYDGGYLQCEGADRGGLGFPLPENGRSAWMVEWSTHDTIRRAVRGQPEGWLAKAIDRGVRYNDCEAAPRQILSLARQEINVRQQLERDRFRLPLQAESRRLRMEQQSANRRFRLEQQEADRQFKEELEARRQ
jgi:hypothetical protein